MKRKDLEVGMVVAVATGKRTIDKPERAVVLSTERWTKRAGYLVRYDVEPVDVTVDGQEYRVEGTSRPVMPHEKKNGVLLGYDAGLGGLRGRTTSLGSILGLWDEVFPQWQEEVRAVQQAREEWAEKDRMRRAELREALSALGIDPDHMGVTISTTGGSVEIDRDVLL